MRWNESYWRILLFHPFLLKTCWSQTGLVLLLCGSPSPLPYTWYSWDNYGFAWEVEITTISIASWHTVVHNRFEFYDLKCGGSSTVRATNNSINLLSSNLLCTFHFYFLGLQGISAKPERQRERERGHPSHILSIESKCTRLTKLWYSFIFCFTWVSFIYTTAVNDASFQSWCQSCEICSWATRWSRSSVNCW